MLPVPSIEPTGDGSQTLRHPVSGDTYHSLRGAAGESEHVFIRGGLAAWLEEHPGGTPRILEIGLGSGLNCLLTERYARQAGLRVEYTAIELYPVPEAVWRAMDYASDALFAAIHEAGWGGLGRISRHLSLHKIAGDLAVIELDATFDVVYMDAFAPDTQPELWTPEVFRKLHAAMAPGGVLATYSAKGDVRRAMGDAGFDVERLPGALGKRHMVKAYKRG